MRNVYEVLREKEDAIARVRREVAALRSVTFLLADEMDARSNLPTPPAASGDGTSTVRQLEDALNTVAPLLADEIEEYVVKLRARLIEAGEDDSKLRRSKALSRQLRHIAASWLRANPMRR